jgi:hypothetical protein
MPTQSLPFQILLHTFTSKSPYLQPTVQVPRHRTLLTIDMSSNPPHRRIQARPATQERPLTILQTVDERTFQTIAQATEYLKQLTPEDRYRVLISQASKLIDLQEELINIWRISSLLTP